MWSPTFGWELRKRCSLQKQREIVASNWYPHCQAPGATSWRRRPTTQRRTTTSKPSLERRSSTHQWNTRFTHNPQFIICVGAPELMEKLCDWLSTQTIREAIVIPPKTKRREKEMSSWEDRSEWIGIAVMWAWGPEREERGGSIRTLDVATWQS